MNIYHRPRVCKERHVDDSSSEKELAHTAHAQLIIIIRDAGTEQRVEECTQFYAAMFTLTTQLVLGCCKYLSLHVYMHFVFESANASSRIRDFCVSIFMCMISMIII